MKEKILTNAVISFILLNVWMLYLFFDYFTEKDQIMHSLGLFLNFVYTAVATVVLAGVLLLIRLVYHFRKKENPLKAHFLYILCPVFGLNIFIIWLICMSLNILEKGSGRLEICAITSLLLSLIILTDIYKSGFKSAT